MSFFDEIAARSQSINSLLCIGLDPHLQELDLPASADESARADAAYRFCQRIIDATHPHAVCYKPNAAFFEALGVERGGATLRRVVDAVRREGVPVLLDVKRGDIGSTAAAYAEACYDEDHGLAGDGATLSPLMGWDSVRPFVTGKYSNKGAFLLCKTSNPGSNDLLALTLPQNKTLFGKIAELANEWSNKAESETPSDSTSSAPPSPRLGLVVGATDPQALSSARASAGQAVWILAPGVGAQGGDLDAACRAGLNDRGSGMLVPVSRGISRASDPEAEASKLKEGINAARRAVLEGRGAKERTSPGDGMAPYQREFLEFSLKEGVLKFGSFVLKSGRTSPYFFNAGLFSTGSALFNLGKSYAAAIMASEMVDKDGKVIFDVVFGPAYKGISLGALVTASLYADFGVDVGFAYNRKEAKDHGEGGVLVGAAMARKRILIVDDVITAGTAIRESHALLTKLEAKPVGVAIALDRAEKRSLEDPLSAVQAVARDLEIPVVSIVALPQLQEFLRSSPDYDENVLNVVTEYRSKYGV